MVAIRKSAIDITMPHNNSRVQSRSSKESEVKGGSGNDRLPRATRYRSLSAELAISLFLLVFIVEGVLLFFIYQRQAAFYYDQLQVKADEYATTLSEILAVPLWDYDDEQVRRIGEGFERNNLVASVVVRDTGGSALYKFDKRSYGDQIVREVSIIREGKDLGIVRFALSLEAYSKDLTWFRDTVLLVLALSLVVIIIATGFFLRVFMRKPLAILYQGMDRVARGEYDYRFGEVHHKELADIASRFSLMANEIQGREELLQREVVVRKHAEEKTRESESRKRAILEAIPDILFQFDKDGRFIDMRGAQEYMEKTPVECISRKKEELMPDSIAPLFKNQLALTFETREVGVFEYDINLHDETHYFECRLVAVSDEVALGIVRDITKRATAAIEKKRLLTQLQRAQKMEAIGMLAGGVAHDLNNILSGLVSYPELILLDLPKKSPLRKPIHTIQKAGERAAQIVQDLLTLARRAVSVSEIANLNQIIIDYLESPEFENLKRHHPGMTLNLDLAEDLLNISGSPIHLTKMVMNLVSNAAEALMQQGTIRIRTVNSYIDTPIKGYDDIEEGDYIVIKVEDSGMGISKEDINHIFEPFYTKKTMGRSGTGLGMAVVWGAIKDHHGYIDVQSQPGHGTTVTIHLPSTKEHRIQAIEATTVDNLQGGGEKILVVDDVSEQRIIAVEMLKRIGYEVESVSSGEMAVGYVRDHPVDILILDMIMDPGIDGLETYRQILKMYPNQRALIVSGFSESDLVQEACRLGAGTYVKKPYLLETIALAVKKELRGDFHKPMNH